MVWEFLGARKERFDGKGSGGRWGGPVGKRERKAHQERFKKRRMAMGALVMM